MCVCVSVGICACVCVCVCVSEKIVLKSYTITNMNLQR